MGHTIFKIVNITLCAVILMLFTLSPALADGDSAGEEIFALVNDEVITVKYFNASLNFQLATSRMFHPGNPSEKALRRMKAETTERLIVRALLLQEAYRINALPTEGEIKQAIAKSLKKYGTEEKLLSYLAGADVDLTSYRKMVRESFITRYYIENFLRPQVKVSKSDCLAYYNSKLEKYAPPRYKSVTIHSFTIKETEELPTVVGEIRQLTAISNWKTLRRESAVLKNRNQDSIIDYKLASGLVIKEDSKNRFWKALSGLTPPATAYLKDTDGKHLLIHYIRGASPPQRTFDEAYNEIYDLLFNKLFSQLLDDKVESLKQKSEIEIKQDINVDQNVTIIGE